LDGAAIVKNLLAEEERALTLGFKGLRITGNVPDGRVVA
jgi:hypothetical protein